MVTKIILPKLGETMEEGVIGKWIKNEGDSVGKGDPILEVATDKANFEVEAPAKGVLRKVLVQASEDNVPILTLLGYIADSMDEELPKEEKPAEAAPAAKAAAPAAAPVAAAKAGQVMASPVAKRIAREKGIDLSTITGTGPGGRITEKDVLAAEGAGGAGAAEEGVENISMSKTRKIIAKRLSQSKREAPHFYVQVDVDMTEAVSLREKLLPKIEKEQGVRVSYNDMIVKAVATTMGEFPLMSANFVGEIIKRFDDANIGVAVSLDDGLVVPVVKQANKKSLGEISKETKELIVKAKGNKLGIQDMSGGTFTVSNMGMLGVDTFLAILNPPEVGILSVGGIKKTPVVINDKVEVRSIMKLSLSVDHRVIDGSYAASFLGSLKGALEKPKFS